MVVEYTEHTSVVAGDQVLRKSRPSVLSLLARGDGLSWFSYAARSGSVVAPGCIVTTKT